MYASWDVIGMENVGRERIIVQSHKVMVGSLEALTEEDGGEARESGKKADGEESEMEIAIIRNFIYW